MQKLEKNICADVQKKNEDLILAEVIKQVDPNVANMISITTSQKKFTEEDLSEIKESMKEQSKPIIDARRQAQEEAILGYIDNNINAGTRMENVIKESVEKVFKFGIE